MPDYIPTDGLVAWWPFNGNANDESGNGNHGLVTGATYTANRAGVSNQAILLNGTSDHITVANSASLQVTSLTLCGWINYAEAPASEKKECSPSSTNGIAFILVSRKRHLHRGTLQPNLLRSSRNGQ